MNTCQQSHWLPMLCPAVVLALFWLLHIFCTQYFLRFVEKAGHMWVLPGLLLHMQHHQQLHLLLVYLVWFLGVWRDDEECVAAVHQFLITNQALNFFGVDKVKVLPGIWLYCFWHRLFLHIPKHRLIHSHFQKLNVLWLAYLLLNLFYFYISLIYGWMWGVCATTMTLPNFSPQQTHTLCSDLD